MASTSSEDESKALTAAQFATTHWSVVLAAGDSASPDSEEALEKSCRTYWFPLYAFVRRRGYSPEDAQDLTQEFLLRLIEKHRLDKADPQRGRFRTFLLATLRHFLCDEWDRSQTIRRGGRFTVISLDADGWVCIEKDSDSPRELHRTNLSPSYLTPGIYFNGDGSKFCTAGDDSTARAYDFTSGMSPAANCSERCRGIGVSSAGWRSVRTGDLWPPARRTDS